jgi:hypothetical protein
MGRGDRMSVALSDFVSPIDEAAGCQRSRVRTALALAGLLFAGFVNVLWIATLGYGLTLVLF